MTGPTAAAAAAVTVQRVLGREGQLREVAARQVTLDDDEPTRADTAEYSASAHHHRPPPQYIQCQPPTQMTFSLLCSGFIRKKVTHV